MAEQVKVYKNDNNVTPSTAEHTGATPLDINLVTTTASQRAVIKDVDFVALGTGKDRVKPVLELNGYAYKTGANGALTVEGNIIVGPSSTLNITSATTAAANPAGGFKGLAFFEGSTGIQKLTGNGVTSTPGSSMAPVKLTSSGTSSDDAVAAIPPTGAPAGGNGADIYFYRVYNNTIYKYTPAGTMVNNWSATGSSYSITADDNYLYRGHYNASDTAIWRTSLADHTTTTLTTGSNYSGPQGNQGSIFVHHEGKIYTRREGGNAYLDIINLSDLSVTRKSSGDFAIGSYSDGGAVVTTLAGKSYIVEAADNAWYYYDISSGSVVKTSQGTSTSTEYAQGGGEIAPGVALIFGEQSDRATVIDMNTKTWTTDSGSHGYTTDYTYGNRFGFAAYLETKSEFTYSTYASGIEIT